MCGIACSVRIIMETSRLIAEELENLISARGPDSQGSTIRYVETENGFLIQLEIFASVLHMHGNELVRQPVCDLETGDVFCWNGEVFDSSFFDIPDGINDTGSLSKRLFSSSSNSELEVFEQDLVSVLKGIEGPFSMVYYHSHSSRLYFSHDILGRRSLIWGTVANSNPFLGSQNGWLLTSVTLKSVSEDFEEVPPGMLYCFDLNEYSKMYSKKPCDLASALQNPFILYNVSPLLEFPLKTLLNRSIASPQEHLVYGNNNELPVPKNELKNCLLEFKEILKESLRSRLLIKPTGEKSVGILFSGGIDCTILAYLSHEILPQDCVIELLNVAFENPRSLKNSTKTGDDVYDVPDRLLGRQTFLELKRVAPQRDFRLIEVNVSYMEYCAKKQYIMNLMCPCTTVMDLSIAAALWFASRGIGKLHKSENGYISTSRVLISGLGADELFGGYSRHRAAFENSTSGSPYEDLLDELAKDIQRIPTRNLGRDDRIISSHGKEVRFPFLALPVVKAALNVPVHWKCDFRTVVTRGLGLHGVCREKKRAIQFGARTAKMVDSKEEGHFKQQ